MLSIEYVHKRVRLFRVELSLVVIACLAVILLGWNILTALKIFK